MAGLAEVSGVFTALLFKGVSVNNRIPAMSTFPDGRASRLFVLPMS
jgi:hypothetical protein